MLIQILVVGCVFQPALLWSFSWLLCGGGRIFLCWKYADSGSFNAKAPFCIAL
jgi:hypothetical protein